MPGDNNPNNSVGGGWHLTHNLIKQIYSYSANSGKKFNDIQRNPNIKCKDNILIYESSVKSDGKNNQIDTGIIFYDMIDFLKSKPRNRNDNSYNTHSTLPTTKEENSTNIEDSKLTKSLKNVDLPKQGKKKKKVNKKNMKKTHSIDY